ncbi:hypothetical protein Bbelb_153730 [Branchiostoma belcheri]|nr:hypothetical protein Bbelb_153730 [Branchiostoma belcheri]
MLKFAKQMVYSLKKIRKLRRELDQSQEKVATLSTQLTTNPGYDLYVAWAKWHSRSHKPWIMSLHISSERFRRHPFADASLAAVQNDVSEPDALFPNHPISSLRIIPMLGNFDRHGTLAAKSDILHAVEPYVSMRTQDLPRTCQTQKTRLFKE